MVDGPRAVFQTTTQPEMDAETTSRFIITSIDESPEQTRAILEAQRHSHTLDGHAPQEAARSNRAAASRLPAAFETRDRGESVRAVVDLCRGPACRCAATTRNTCISF